MNSSLTFYSAATDFSFFFFFSSLTRENQQNKETEGRSLRGIFFVIISLPVNHVINSQTGPTIHKIISECHKTIILLLSYIKVRLFHRNTDTKKLLRNSWNKSCPFKWLKCSWASLKACTNTYLFWTSCACWKTFQSTGIKWNNIKNELHFCLI